jgi:hypothetical protein
MVFACVLAPAAGAYAHNGTGGASSDYRIRITGFDGDASGVHLQVIELGKRLQIQRGSAADVMILGYSGEPYLHLDADGVFENTNSPAYYLNLDRFASANPPASASATATPAWTMLSSGTSVKWHDHRAHWMSNTPRADVLADPDVERVIFPAQRIEMIIDGKSVAAVIEVTWLPTPDQYIWLAAAALLGLAVAAVFVLRPGTAKLLPFVAFAGAVASLLGQGTSPFRHVVGAAAIVLAVVAVRAARWQIGAASAAVAGVLATTRLEVYQHELLAGEPGGVGQRIAILVALGACLGVVASVLVGALGPTPAPVTPRTAGAERRILQ